MKPHKHAELIKAWADGAEVEFKSKADGQWHLMDSDCAWLESYQYRIKPEPKPDVVRYLKKSAIHGWYETNDVELSQEGKNCATLKLIYDGETGEPKSAEVLR